MRKSLASPFVRTCVAAAAMLPCVVAAALADESAAVMLRRGVWDGGVGSYEVPAPLAALPSSRWPTEGWQRLQLHNNRIDSVALSGKDATPAFLESIVDQVDRPIPSDDVRPELANEIFLRVPGTALSEGPLRTVRFRNGTSSIVPELGFRYELALEGREFAFTVQNGLRAPSGAPYGSGARYVIEYDGEAYEYLVGEFGWSSRIEAIVDLDGDGKPDFIIHVDGNNSGDEVVLLSSRARPGRNRATAQLHSMGC